MMAAESIPLADCFSIAQSQELNISLLPFAGNSWTITRAVMRNGEP